MMKINKILYDYKIKSIITLSELSTEHNEQRRYNPNRFKKKKNTFVQFGKVTKHDS